jgi:hypothetical protein
LAVEKSYAEINEKIKQGKAVVVTAEEIIDLVKEKGVEKTAREVDVVTTGTFGTMCSSGAFLNFGHAKPRIKMNRAYLNGVPAYAGIAAVDAYIGATALPESDPDNRVYPRRLSRKQPLLPLLQPLVNGSILLEARLLREYPSYQASRNTSFEF